MWISFIYTLLVRDMIRLILAMISYVPECKINLSVEIISDTV